MAHLLDYLGYELSSFDERPLSAPDSAALSQAAMLDGEGIVPGVPEEPGGILPRLGSALRRVIGRRQRPVRFADLLRAERFDHMFRGLVPEPLRQCLFALAASPRFRDLEIRDYRSVFDEERRTQFAAMAFVWRDEFSYIAFRGTDTSITGWRENFDMAYLPEVPAQELALRYLEEVAPHLPGRLHVGGHSKGGNLALFAALCASDAVASRIDRVWVHDAPGFKPGRFPEQRYERLAGRIDRTMPQDAIVSMLMDCPAPWRCVQADASGMDQHSVFTWRIEGGDFVYRDGPGDSSRFLHDVLDEWMASMGDDAARGRVVDAIFSAIEASGVHDAGEILLGGPSKWVLLAEGAKNLSPEPREMLMSSLRDLSGIALRRMGRSVYDKLPWT